MRAFERFIHQVHRRRSIWRLFEHLTLSLLAGSALAAATLPLLWWRGADTIAPTFALLTMALLCGALIALRRSPQLVESAQLVEAHLNAPELLTTALTVPRNNPFADAVIALADARVASVSVSSIVLRRLTNRTVASALFATAGVLTIAMMFSSHGTQPALAGAPQDLSRAGGSQMIGAESAAASSIHREPDSISERFSRDTLSSGKNESASRDHSSTSDAVRGGGNASSDSHTTPRGSNAMHRAATERDGETSATGDGVATVNPTARGDEFNSATIRAARPADRAAPWSASRWGADRERALAIVREQSVPDAYRELIKDYFDAR